MNFGYQEAIVAIADCAFVTSEYPVILSFENHCCRAQQYKLAKYSEEMFGEFLGKDPVPGYPVTHFLTPLYSPPNTFSIKCPNRIKCSWLINWICMFFFFMNSWNREQVFRLLVTWSTRSSSRTSVWSRILRNRKWNSSAPVSSCWALMKRRKTPRHRPMLLPKNRYPPDFPFISFPPNRFRQLPQQFQFNSIEMNFHSIIKSDVILCQLNPIDLTPWWMKMSTWTSEKNR